MYPVNHANRGEKLGDFMFEVRQYDEWVLYILWDIGNDVSVV